MNVKSKGQETYYVVNDMALKYAKANIFKILKKILLE